MNMISTGAFLNEMDASNKQPTVAEKFAAVWEKKNAKAARAGGVSLMALSLAACGSSSTTTTSTTTSTDTSTTATTTPVTAALTVNTDDVDGTAGNDTVSGARIDDVQTFGNGDTIDLGAGTDSLTATLNAGTVRPASVTGVETITFTALGSATVDMDNVSGMTSIVSNASSAALVIDDIQALTDITISNTSQAHTIMFKDALLTGSTDALTLNLESVSGGIITMGGETDNDGDYETLTINVTGTNTTGNVALGTEVTTLNIAGTGSLDINAGAEFAKVTTITSTASGDVDIALADRATTSTTSDLSITMGGGDDDVDISLVVDADVDNITVDLGAGDDRLVLDTNGDTGNSIDGGAGTDTLSLDIAMSTTVETYVSNFEVLEFNMRGADLTQDMDNADGINVVHVLDSGSAGCDLNIDDAADGIKIHLNGAALATTATGTASNADIAILSIDDKTDTASDTATVYFDAAAGDVNVAQFDPNANYETITVVSSGTAENTIQTVSTSLRNITIEGSTAFELTSTGSLGGVVDASGLDAAFTTTTSTTAITVNSGDKADSLTSGLLATGVTQTINGGGGNDTLTAGQIVTTGNLVLNGDAGSDTINVAAMDGNSSGTVISTFKVNGGEGVDFIVLDAVDTYVVGDVVSTVEATADADLIDDFDTTEDDIDYNGTLKNGTVTTVDKADDTTLAAAISEDATATVYYVTGNLTGAAATALTNLADDTTSEEFLAAADTFIDAYVAAIGSTAITGLDNAISGTDTVLIVVDNNADTAVLRFQNTDTAVANTITAAELELVAVLDAGVLVDGDII